MEEETSNIHIDVNDRQRTLQEEGQLDDVETNLEQALQESALGRGRQTGQSTSTEHELEA